MFSLRNIRRRETRGWTLIGLPPVPAFNARTALLERAGSSVWMPDVTSALRGPIKDPATGIRIWRAPGGRISSGETSNISWYRT
jgi:hypothetical protein